MHPIHFFFLSASSTASLRPVLSPPLARAGHHDSAVRAERGRQVRDILRDHLACAARRRLRAVAGCLAAALGAERILRVVVIYRDPARSRLVTLRGARLLHISPFGNRRARTDTSVRRDALAAG